MSLKDKLRENQVTLGTWLTIGHQSVAEIMAATDLEWIVIDHEHSVIELSEIQGLIATIQSYQKAALVRVAKNDEVFIKKVLDSGADGVLVPMVKTAEEARQAVSYAKYPPEGKRGVGLARAQKYGTGFEEYLQWQEKELVVIVQIEHIDAVDNLEEIVAVEGVDGIIIGPYDLSGSMGFPGEFERAEVIGALERVKQICKDTNTAMGYHVIDPDFKQLQSKVEEGYVFLGFSLDFLFIGAKLRDELKSFNNGI